MIYRAADPYPRLRMPVLILLSFVFYGYWNPAFVALLTARSWSTGWRRSLRRDQQASSSRRRSSPISRARRLQVHQLLRRHGHVAGHSGRPVRDRAAARHHVLHLPPHHVSGRPAARAAPKLSRSTATRSTSASSRRRSPGPLARWSEVRHQFGRDAFTAGWEQRCALGVTFIMIGLIEKIAARRPDRPDSGPDLRRRPSRPAARRLAGSRWASPSRSSSISPAIPTSRSGLDCCSAFSSRSISTHRCARPASWTFWQRWHMTLIALPARLSCSCRSRTCGSRTARCACGQHFAAMLLTMALCGLWHGAGWTFVLWGTLHGSALVFVSLWRRRGLPLPLPARVGVDGRVRDPDLRDLPRRLAGSRVAHLRGAWSFAGSRKTWARGADRRRGALRVPLPASQDIVARLMERPRAAIAAALALIGVAMLVELGDRDTYEFVYFQF